MSRGSSKVAGVVGLIAAMALWSCSLVTPMGSNVAPTASPFVGAGSAVPAGAISIPTGEETALDRCLLNAGFRPTVIHPPSLPGEKPWYEWESDLPLAENVAKLSECRDRYSPYKEKTAAELRVVYDRWINERNCLASKGYDPVQPPSFEKFVADWKIGPWTPLAGIDTRSWTDAQYAEAKKDCTLEMYDRG